jgi:hypothetical protein
MIRASTAPARPYTDMEEFRRSEEFLLLEQSVLCSGQLMKKNNQKFDLDSQEGQKSCKKYLKMLERLHEVIHFCEILLFLSMIWSRRVVQLVGFYENDHFDEVVFY